MSEEKMQITFGRYVLTIHPEDQTALEDLASSKDNKVLCQLLMQVAELAGKEMREAVRRGESVKAAGLEGQLDLAESLIILLDDGLQIAFAEAKGK